MKLLAVNLAELSETEYNGKKVLTGIFKKAVDGRVQATVMGLEGDVQADLEIHGGADKAIYVYSIEHYAFWKNELKKKELPYGQFGENLTVEGMTDETVHIGDIFRIGQATLQVTQPRIPCYKLGIRLGSSRFPKQFLKSGRVGFYLRVLSASDIGSGDKITRIGRHPSGLSVEQSLKALSKGPQQEQIISMALEIDALSKAWRSDLKRRLENLN